MFSKTERDGELFVDHRASPGAPAGYAQRLGFRRNLFGEGTSVTIPTSGCVHCGTPQILNPSEERDWCSVCDAYLCLYCGHARKQPGYVHITMREVIDKVRTGKFTVMGSAHAPRLIPLEALGVTEPPPLVSIQTDDHGIRRL